MAMATSSLALIAATCRAVDQVVQHLKSVGDRLYMCGEGGNVSVHDATASLNETRDVPQRDTHVWILIGAMKDGSTPELSPTRCQRAYSLKCGQIWNFFRQLTDRVQI